MLVSCVLGVGRDLRAKRTPKMRPHRELNNSEGEEHKTKSFD